MDAKKRQKFESRLLDLRSDMLGKRQQIDESWQSLHKKEIEFEERAANEQLAAGLDYLDEQEEKFIEAIDRALVRLEENVYDVCESCGGSIAEKRLEAVPWATMCIDCASGKRPRKNESALPADSEESALLPGDLRGMTDEQLRMAVIDAIQRDGRIATEELTVTCENKVVRLEGLLPDDRQRSHLREVVHDVLGFRDIEENIRIDRMAWARRDRTPGIGKADTMDTDDSGSGSGTETIDAVKEGKTMTPADEIIPEKKK